MPSVALSWAEVSVTIELTTHTSSITPASSGNSSLTGVPLFPAGLNVQFGRFRNRVNDPFCMNHRSAVTLLPWSAYSFGDRSSTGLSFPMWIYYSALPAGGLLMSVRYIGRLYRFCFRYDPATMTIGALHHEPIAAGK